MIGKVNKQKLPAKTCLTWTKLFTWRKKHNILLDEAGNPVGEK
ncbi:MAG: DUF2256 domain-containing protein [Bacteroidetes bacterium]|nr:DUF2256 domain-containing protein [Bacteroidota bacterium]